MGKPLRSFFRHPLFLCSLSFIACFLLGLLLSFPLDPFVRQLEQQVRQQGVQLEIGAAQAAFPPALKIEQIGVSSPALPHPPLLLTDLIIKPLWTTLAGNNPGIGYKLELWQGSVHGQAFSDGKLSATFSDLHIDEPFGPQLPLRLGATLKTGRFDGTLPLVGNNSSQLQLQLTELTLSGLKALGGENNLLPLGELTCSASGIGPRLNIEALQIKGPAVALNASGILHLGPNPARSIVNLNVTLKPEAGLAPWLRQMLSLLPATVQADGSYRFRLRGSLAAVRIN